MTWREEILGDGQVREVARSMTRWFAYVDWPDVPRYEAAGWMHPATQVSYSRTTMVGAVCTEVGKSMQR